MIPRETSPGSTDDALFSPASVVALFVLSALGLAVLVRYILAALRGLRILASRVRGLFSGVAAGSPAEHGGVDVDVEIGKVFQYLALRRRRETAVDHQRRKWQRLGRRLQTHTWATESRAHGFVKHARTAMKTGWDRRWPSANAAPGDSGGTSSKNSRTRSCK